MRVSSMMLLASLALAGCGQSPTAVDPPVAAAFLVTDIRPGPPGSDPAYFTPLDPRRTVFVAGDDLWVTDGTARGTILLRSFADNPYHLTRAGRFVFFAVSDAPHGNELWRTDGTAAGTGLVEDINPGPSLEYPARGGDSYPQDLVDVNGTLFFAACDEEHGQAVWKSDVMAAVLVADIDPRPLPSDGCLGRGTLSNFVAMGGVAYFFADHPAVGFELWRSDGTAEGTGLVKDALPGPDPPRIGRGPDHPDPGELVRLRGALFFRRGGRLWRSDGTFGGPSGWRRSTPSFSRRAARCCSSRAGGSGAATARPRARAR